MENQLFTHDYLLQILNDFENANLTSIMYNFSSIESMMDEFSMMFNHFKSELFNYFVAFMQQAYSSKFNFDNQKFEAAFLSLQKQYEEKSLLYRIKILLDQKNQMTLNKLENLQQRDDDNSQQINKYQDELKQLETAIIKMETSLKQFTLKLNFDDYLKSKDQKQNLAITNPNLTIISYEVNSNNNSQENNIQHQKIPLKPINNQILPPQIQKPNSGKNSSVFKMFDNCLNNITTQNKIAKPQTEINHKQQQQQQQKNLSIENFEQSEWNYENQFLSPKEQIHLNDHYKASIIKQSQDGGEQNNTILHFLEDFQSEHQDLKRESIFKTLNQSSNSNFQICLTPDNNEKCKENNEQKQDNQMNLETQFEEVTNLAKTAFENYKCEKSTPISTFCNQKQKQKPKLPPTKEKAQEQSKHHPKLKSIGSLKELAKPQQQQKEIKQLSTNQSVISQQKKNNSNSKLIGGNKTISKMNVSKDQINKQKNQDQIKNATTTIQASRIDSIKIKNILPKGHQQKQNKENIDKQSFGCKKILNSSCSIQQNKKIENPKN